MPERSPLIETPPSDTSTSCPCPSYRASTERSMVTRSDSMFASCMSEEASDSFRRCQRIQSQLPRDFFDSRASKIDVKFDFAAGEAIGVDQACHHRGIGYRRLRAPLAVAHWPRICAGAARSNVQQPAIVDP